METIINICVVCFTFLVIIFVEGLLYKKAIDEKRIADYQKVLDEIVKKVKTKHNLDWKYDARAEILKERNQTKSFIFIFSGIFLAFILIGLSIFASPIPTTNIMIICISSFFLICFGLIKTAESRKSAIIILLAILIVVVGLIKFIDSLMTMPSYPYLYFCGLMLVVYGISRIKAKY